MNRKAAFIVLGVLALGFAFWAGWGLRTPAPPAESAAQALYHCPMHPQMTSDHPADCPICGMRMVPSRHVGQQPSHADSGVEGQAIVDIAPERQQRIGLQTSEVTLAPFTRTVHAVGRVVPAETALHHVHTKVGGFVEILYANATGAQVVAGMPLMDIYSPELLASQQEYLVALQARDRLRQSARPSVLADAESLAESARRRLLLYDVTPDQITELEKTRTASRTLTLRAPVGGTILSRMVTQGEKIEPGTTVLDIADLSRVWVLADVYEYELPFVKTGQKARMTISYLAGQSFEGTVSLIYPTVDPVTRTIKLRLEYPNPRGALRPEMFAEVDLRADLGPRLSVPAGAVISSGRRDLVFVQQGEGSFEPREVTLGLRLPDSVEILAGLTAGERVVTAGNFFVDSESRLKAAAQSPASGHAH